MNDLYFKYLEKNNITPHRHLKNLMIPYFKEINNHNNLPPLDDNIIIQYTNSMINKIGLSHRHLLLCYLHSEPIGFSYYKIEYEDNEFDDIPYGYIMEFYIKPEDRKKGYGRNMYSHIRDHLVKYDIDNCYLTSNKVTGKPFWKALGFIYTGKISKDNNQEIYRRLLY